MLPNIFCRVCATTDTALDLLDIFEKEDASECVADMLLEVAELKVAVDDGFPQSCCKQCHTDLVRAVTVRRKCIESEKLFHATVESCYSVIDEQYDDQSDSLSIASPKHEHIALEENFTYRCCECSIDFGDSEALKIHYESKHAKVIHGWESFGLSEISLFDTSDEEVEEDAGAYPQAPEPLQTNKLLELYRCCGCMLIFDTDADLQQHSETVHASNALQVDGDNAWQCNVCYKLFTCAAALENHQNTVYFLRYQCYTCGLLFGTQAHLSRHEFKHMRGKFTCEPCEKIFSNPQSMRRHMQRFHDKSRTLRTQEKHICSECGKAVHSAAYLVSHMRLHSKELPFTCTLCGARFKLVRYLKWHMAMHKGLYKCKQCDSSYKSPSELQEHMNRHTGTRAFCCFLCGNGFHNKKNLNKHLRMVHSHYVSKKKE